MNGLGIASAPVAGGGPLVLAADPPGAAAPAHVERVGVEARWAGAEADGRTARASRP